MIKARCPSQDELFSFGVGKVSDVQATEIAEHLESCDNCQAVMETLDDAGDTLASCFRGQYEPDEYQEEQACRRAVGILICASGSLDT